MSEAKTVKNKLDPKREQIREWAAEGKTLAEIVQQLREDGVTSSISSVGEYLQRMRDKDSEEAFLSQIASGANHCRQVEAEFAKNPAPELETVMKMHRVLSMQMATQANANPKAFKILGSLMASLLEYARLQKKGEELAQAERKLKILEENHAKAKAELESALTKRTDGGLTPEALKQIEEAAKLL